MRFVEWQWESRCKVKCFWIHSPKNHEKVNFQNYQYLASISWTNFKKFFFFLQLSVSLAFFYADISRKCTITLWFFCIIIPYACIAIDSGWQTIQLLQSRFYVREAHESTQMQPPSAYCRVECIECRKNHRKRYSFTTKIWFSIKYNELRYL